MSVYGLNSVEDTTLWRQLKEGFQGHNAGIAAVLASNLVNICREASDRMRSFPSLHPQYTLHDQVHLLRVTELMAHVLPPEVLQSLNPVEIALLILAAHFHDQGMVMESGEIAALESNPEFKIFKQNWEVEHPNLHEVREHISDRNLNGDERKKFKKVEWEIHAALLTDYIRGTHGERSADFVKTRYGSDRRWDIEGVSIAGLVALVCESHVEDASKLVPANGFRHDEVVGNYSINMPYLALVLRLADILDFDRERTPGSLYRTIDFTSRISLEEWEKHRSVQGWTVKQGLIQFTMKCEQPEYQRAAYHFMDWIDKELSGALDIVQGFPAPFERYKWHLPAKTDRSRIEPKDHKYIYYDLEFSLSRDEVVKLLMMDQLYGGPWLCVRELIQNSLDALRYRKALFKRDSGVHWPQGKVSLTHYVNDQGHEVLRCADNGSGMDEDIVKRFLTRAGRSYYRSPDFEQERSRFKAAGVDFDPCAQFGIGFMSCFMIGDRIQIKTRRDYGVGRHQGKPIAVEINGLGGMIVIREGPQDQPIGTTIEVIGRRKPSYLEHWTDNVRLTSVVRGYALACEFPIEATCSIPEITESTSQRADPIVPATIMERLGLKEFATISQEFSAINPYLSGQIRTSILVDAEGKFCTKNEEAFWDSTDLGARKVAQLKLANGATYNSGQRENQTCIDGILVGGRPGRIRGNEEPLLGSYANPIGCGQAEFILDIRGPIKPPLTPSRRPPDRALGPDGDPLWGFIQRCVSLAEARLWEQIIARHGFDSPLVLWKLALLYSAPFASMASGVIWDSLQIAFIGKSNSIVWKTLPDLDYLRVSIHEGQLDLSTWQNEQLASAPHIVEWMGPDRQPFQSIVLGMASLEKADQELRLRMLPPADRSNPPMKLDRGFFGTVHALPFLGELNSLLSLKHVGGIRSYGITGLLNKNHLVARNALDSQFAPRRSELQTFCQAIVSLMTGNEPLAFSPQTQTMPLRYRYIGGLYRSVESIMPTELRPPYSSILPTGEIVSIDAPTLEKWAAAKPEIVF
jgi:hypothetical protein